jgi:hypothetical protein
VAHFGYSAFECAVYCGPEHRLMLASLGYLDTFIKVGGSWLFAREHYC